MLLVKSGNGGETNVGWGVQFAPVPGVCVGWGVQFAPVPGVCVGWGVQFAPVPGVCGVRRPIRPCAGCVWGEESNSPLCRVCVGWGVQFAPVPCVRSTCTGAWSSSWCSRLWRGVTSAPETCWPRAPSAARYVAIGGPVRSHRRPRT